VCIANLSPRAIDLPEHEEILLSSTALEVAGDGAARLPTDSTAWLRT
jgi:alpha-glucosidase